MSGSNRVTLVLAVLVACGVVGCVFDGSGYPGSSENNANSNDVNSNDVNSNDVNNNNVTPPSCGDGVIDFEGCDDGNALDGDGCSQTCQVESGWSCTGEPSTCVVVCGDAIVHTSEGCDDSNTMNDDGCSQACLVESGWSCTGEPSTCGAICGDSQTLGTETCDDGDSVDGDGCSQTCQVESGWSCTGDPSTCLAICGDSQTLGTETCDDGNTVGGDGCSVSCQLEPYHDDLVAHWKMDDSIGAIASDSTGGNDGALQNMSNASWVAGRLGGALDFDGTDDYVSVGAIGTYDTLTIAMWVHLDAVYMSSLFHCDGWGAGDLHFIITADGAVRFALNGNQPTDQDSVYSFSTHLNEWHHIAVVYDMAAMTVDFFLDGVHDVQQAYTTTRTVELGPLRIGSASCCGRYFDGRMDDLRIYNAVVSDAHIGYLSGL